MFRFYIKFIYNDKTFCVFLIVMDGDRRIIFCRGRSGWLYLFLGETGVDGKIDALV